MTTRTDAGVEAAARRIASMRWKQEYGGLREAPYTHSEYVERFWEEYVDDGRIIVAAYLSATMEPTKEQVIACDGAMPYSSPDEITPGRRKMIRAMFKAMRSAEIAALQRQPRGE